MQRRSGTRFLGSTPELDAEFAEMVEAAKRPKVEVTPEMAAAGADALLSFTLEDLAVSDPAEVVRQVYRAMAPLDVGCQRTEPRRLP